MHKGGGKSIIVIVDVVNIHLGASTLNPQDLTERYSIKKTRQRKGEGEGDERGKKEVSGKRMR